MWSDSLFYFFQNFVIAYNVFNQVHPDSFSPLTLLSSPPITILAQLQVFKTKQNNNKNNIESTQEGAVYVCIYYSEESHFWFSECDSEKMHAG